MYSKREARKERKKTGIPLEEKGFSMFARDGLYRLIEENLDMGVFDSSKINCYMTCVRAKHLPKKTGIPAIKYFNVREFNKQERMRILLATSAIPFIFPQEKIGGYYYYDGGSQLKGDNLPLKPLIEREHCDTVIVVHLDRDVERKNIDPSVYPGVRIYEIRPKDDQGGLFKGILDFKAESATERILQGYNDNIDMFRHIEEDREMLQSGAEKRVQMILGLKHMQEKIRKE